MYSSVSHKAFKLNELIPVLVFEKIRKGTYKCRKKNVPECLYVIMSTYVHNVNFEKLEQLKYFFKKGAYHLLLQNSSTDSNYIIFIKIN